MANHYIQRFDLSKYTLKSFDGVDEICADTNNSDALTYDANGVQQVIVSVPTGGTSAPTITSTTTSATPGTVNGLSVAETVGTSLTSGTVDAIRGLFTLPSGKSMGSGVFAYGITGRNSVAGTVDIGSASLAAVYAKADYNGATLTSGHIAPLQSNIVNPPADSSKVDLVYVESAGGNVINSHFKAFGKASYVFDIETNAHSPEASETTAVGVTQNGYLSVNVNGSQRYIPLYTTHA